MKKRTRYSFRDAPVAMALPGPGDNPEQDSELVAELDGIGYVLVTGNDGKTRIYKAASPEMEKGTTDRRMRTRDQTEGWATVMQRLERIEQALLILAEDYNSNPDPEDEESIDQQSIRQKLTAADRRRRGSTSDQLFRPDPAIKAINDRNRKHYKH